MRKLVAINGHRFYITINLNHEVERRPNGKRFHLLKISHAGETNFEWETKVDSIDKIELAISEAEIHASEWTAGRTLITEEEKFLTNLGFSKV